MAGIYVLFLSLQKPCDLGFHCLKFTYAFLPQQSLPIHRNSRYLCLPCFFVISRWTL